MALTAMRERFVDEYLVDLNATQAAIRAGYSPKTAYSMGQRLLKDVEVQAAVQEARARREKRTEITQDRVVQEIADNAFRQASDAQDSEFKHSSKTKYLDMLCKHLGVYDKSMQVEITDGSGVVLMPEVKHDE